MAPDAALELAVKFCVTVIKTHKCLSPTFRTQHRAGNIVHEDTFMSFFVVVVAVLHLR